MRIWLLLVMVALSACSQNDPPIITQPTENSCKALSGGRWTHSSGDRQLLARDYATFMEIAMDPLVCEGTGKGFAFSYYYECGTTSHCLFVFIRADLGKKLQETLPAVIAHEVAHWAPETPGAGGCHKFEKFEDYTRCEHRIDLRASDVVGMDLMIRALRKLIIFADEHGEPYPNAVWGWQMRIRMLEEIQKLSL